MLIKCSIAVAASAVATTMLLQQPSVPAASVRADSGILGASFTIYRQGLSTLVAGASGQIVYANADAGAAIQWTIQQVAAVRGQKDIEIRAGEYALGGGLTIQAPNVSGSVDLSGLRIRGAGRGVTILESPLLSGTALWVRGGVDNEIHDLHIEGLTLQGPTNYWSGSANGISGSYVYHSSFRDLEIRRFGGNGLEQSPGFYNEFVFCHIEDIGGDGLYLHHATSGNMVHNCHIRMCGAAGLRVGEQTGTCNVQGGTFQSCKYGIRVEQMDNMNLDGVYCEGNRQHDLYASSAQVNTPIYNLVVTNGYFAGIPASGAGTESVLLDQVWNSTFIGGETCKAGPVVNRAITTTSTCRDIAFLNFLVYSGAETLLGVNVRKL